MYQSRPTVAINHMHMHLVLHTSWAVTALLHQRGAQERLASQIQLWQNLCQRAGVKYRPAESVRRTVSSVLFSPTHTSGLPAFPQALQNWCALTLSGLSKESVCLRPLSRYSDATGEVSGWVPILKSLSKHWWWCQSSRLCPLPVLPQGT